MKRKSLRDQPRKSPWTETIVFKSKIDKTHTQTHTQEEVQRENLVQESGQQDENLVEHLRNKKPIGTYC